MNQYFDGKNRNFSPIPIGHFWAQSRSLRADKSSERRHRPPTPFGMGIFSEDLFPMAVQASKWSQIHTTGRVKSRGESCRFQKIILGCVIFFVLEMMLSETLAGGFTFYNIFSPPIPGEMRSNLTNILKMG